MVVPLQACQTVAMIKVAVPPGTMHWADLLGGVLRREIDAGRLVRVSLPGSQVPILVEDGGRWLDLLVIRDPQGARYHVADPAGVVIICDPPRQLEPGEKPYWMQVDEPGWKPKKDG